MLDWALISKAYREADENRKDTSDIKPDETSCILMGDCGAPAWPGIALQNIIDSALFLPSLENYCCSYKYQGRSKKHL